MQSFLSFHHCIEVTLLLFIGFLLSVPKILFILLFFMPWALLVIIIYSLLFCSHPCLLMTVSFSFLLHQSKCYQFWRCSESIKLLCEVASYYYSQYWSSSFHYSISLTLSCANSTMLWDVFVHVCFFLPNLYDSWGQKLYLIF